MRIISRSGPNPPFPPVRARLALSPSQPHHCLSRTVHTVPTIPSDASETGPGRHSLALSLTRKASVLRAWGAPAEIVRLGAPMSQGVIAIVDVDEAVRRAMMTLVRPLGYEVSAFSSAESFLKSEQITET